MKFPFPAIAEAWRERRTVHQRTPDVGEGDVERIVRRDFLKEQFDSVMAALTEYAKGKPSSECLGVRLAALKLAHGNLESLRRNIAVARRDFRDIVMPAQYPEYTKRGWVLVRKLPRKEQERIVNSDWDQYWRWLGK